MKNRYPWQWWYRKAGHRGWRYTTLPHWRKPYWCKPYLRSPTDVDGLASGPVSRIITGQFLENANV